MLGGFARRSRGLFGAGAAVGLACCALGFETTVAAAAPADSASLTITYTTPTSLGVMLADGTPVKTGSVVPAGSYMVYVKDDPNTGDLSPNITISGPGVSLSNNLNSSGMGIDGISSFGPYILQPSSSYSIEDSTLGASSLVTFTTTATSSTGGSSAGGSTGGSSGSSSGGASSAGGSSSGSSSNGGSSSGSSGTSSSGSGSAATKVRGTLAGSVSSAGIASLTLAGKAVKTLTAGSYTLTVADHSSKDRFILEEVSAHPHPITLGGSTLAGKHSETLTLKAGKWFFEPSTQGPKAYFKVIA